MEVKHSPPQASGTDNFIEMKMLLPSSTFSAELPVAEGDSRFQPAFFPYSNILFFGKA